jgi:K+-transporting ATPase ATPase C chain
MEALRQVKTALILLLLFTFVTGIIYPVLVTFIAQEFFPWQANGSLIELNGKVTGSALIGQSFDAPEYFWGRPSATSPYPYNAANSSGSNMGPTNPDFLKTVSDRIKQVKVEHSAKDLLVPVDLVTASGSGLDPDISPAAAYYQIPRVARASHMPAEEIEKLINGLIINRTLGLLGEPRVNVLKLNLALDKLRSTHARAPSQSR